MASHAYGIPSDADAKEDKADPDEETLNAKVKAELDAAFQAGEEIDLKLAVDEGGNPTVWFEIDGADVPVDKVGWNARASRSSLWTPAYGRCAPQQVLALPRLCLASSTSCA